MTGQPKLFHHAYLIILACISMCLGVGITYNTAGIFFPSILKELEMSRGALALYMSGIGITSAIFLPIFGKLMKGKHARLVCSIVALIHRLATASMSMFTNVYHWYIVSAALGCCMALFSYVAPPPELNQMWADKPLSGSR